MRPFFENADLLIAADCTAFTCATMHHQWMRNKITIIGCPKLDQTNYSDKLAQIFTQNTIKSVTVMRMEVPCCSGLARATQIALGQCGKEIPNSTVIVGIHGQIKVN